MVSQSPLQRRSTEPVVFQKSLQGSRRRGFGCLIIQRGKANDRDEYESEGRRVHGFLLAKFETPPQAEPLKAADKDRHRLWPGRLPAVAIYRASRVRADSAA